jgi:hypothetical protein
VVTLVVSIVPLAILAVTLVISIIPLVLPVVTQSITIVPVVIEGQLSPYQHYLWSC